jgi:LysM repeat protein
MMSRTIMGIPMPFVIIGVVAIAAYLFMRNKSSSGSSGQGTSSTGNTSDTTVGGDLTTNPGGLQSLTVNYPDTMSGTGGTPGGGDVEPPTGDNDNEGSGTPNPQPRPPRPPKGIGHHQHVKTPASQPAKFVTVATWPGASTGGLAQWNTTMWGIAKHSGISLAQLEKLNPQIKNPNVIQPGQRVRIS